MKTTINIKLHSSHTIIATTSASFENSKKCTAILSIVEVKIYNTHYFKISLYCVQVVVTSNLPERIIQIVLYCPCTVTHTHTHTHTHKQATNTPNHMHGMCTVNIVNTPMNISFHMMNSLGPGACNVSTVVNKVIFCCVLYRHCPCIYMSTQ